MAPMHNTDRDNGYSALAALPLPEAAIVIDARQSDDETNLLLGHLKTELEDLAAEMRARDILHWAYLNACVDLLRLDSLPPVHLPQQDSDFLITLPDGEQRILPGASFAMQAIGDEYIDRIRTARLRVPDGASSTLKVGGVRQPTVRVFFLADMNEPESLTRAATYAHWLKTWTEQEHGRQRAHRNSRLHMVVICLNTRPAFHDVLLETLGQLPDDAIDTAILLQKYGDDEATINHAAQLRQAELLLYALILRWPDILWRRIDDPIKMHPRFVEKARVLPWPAYLIGVASFEYSARWSARWLDYTVAGKLLAYLNDEQRSEQDQPVLASNMQKWLDTWWNDLRAIVPDMLSMESDMLQGFSSLQAYTRTHALSRSSLHEVTRNLDTLSQSIRARYLGTQATLQTALDQGHIAILDQLRWLNEHASDDEIEEPYRRLLALYQKLQRFLGLHFKEARGAVPRGLHQLEALTTRIQKTIYEDARRSVNLALLQTRFEEEARDASEEAARTFATWPLLPGEPILRSTAISWLITIIIGIIVLFGVDWQSLLSTALNIPVSSLLTGVTWGARAILLALIAGGECLYLAVRNHALRRRCRDIEGRLGRRIQQHLAETGDVIAARVALALLEQADLYARGKDSSPYTQRLQAFAQTGKRAEVLARHQQTLAETRLQIDDGSPDRLPPLDLQTRLELIDWPRLEDAFLEAFKSLASSPPANLLSEMILRQLGTERPVAMLGDMWSRQRWLAGTDRNTRFQALSALLVALLLVSPVTHPQLAEVLSALQEYAAIKTLVDEEHALPGMGTIELHAAVKQAMVEQARSQGMLMPDKDKEKQGVNALIAWTNRQHEAMPQIQDVFASNDILEHITAADMQPAQIIDALYKQGTLAGYPDEISGEDSYHLFSAPGTDKVHAAFLQELNIADYQTLRREPFPDREKLIYLRIHQVRQIFSLDTPGDAQQHSSTSSTRLT